MPDKTEDAENKADYSMSQKLFSIRKEIKQCSKQERFARIMSHKTQSVSGMLRYDPPPASKTEYIQLDVRFMQYVKSVF